MPTGVSMLLVHKTLGGFKYEVQHAGGNIRRH